MVAYLAVKLPTFGHPEVTHWQDGCASWDLDQPSGTPRWSDRLGDYRHRKANRRAPRGGVKKSYVMVGSYRVEPNGLSQNGYGRQETAEAPVLLAELSAKRKPCLFFETSTSLCPTTSDGIGSVTLQRWTVPIAVIPIITGMLARIQAAWYTHTHTHCMDRLRGIERGHVVSPKFHLAQRLTLS